MVYCLTCDPKSKYDHCICNDVIRNFEETYEYIKVSPCERYDVIKNWAISTITICAKFNAAIDTTLYLQNYEIKETASKFYNCINIYISVKYQNKSRVSAKIFTNGNIQLAGVTNVKAATYALRKIFKRLLTLGAFIGDAYISDIRICMINSDFKIGKNIKQTEFCSILDKCVESNDSNILRYSFNSSKYPGINIKFLHDNSQTTCSIFRPGSIMITGGNNVKNYKTIIENVCDLLKNNYQLLY